MTEQELQTQVADYIRLQYPNVLFHSDFGSGIKLTKGQAMKQKRLQGGRRAWPDMFIAEPRTVKVGNDKHVYCGLFIELKKDKTRLYKKDGSYASEHILEQDEMLRRLARNGYVAEFAIGFDMAKELIDWYLG